MNVRYILKLSRHLSSRSWNVKVTVSHRSKRNRMSETDGSSCDRYCGEYCNSKYNLHCILAV